MRSWIDNSGLHDVGRMLDKAQNKHLSTIKGLIQFCELLIFSDKLLMSNYDGSKVFEITNEIISDLNKIGVSKDLIYVDIDDSKTYYNAAIDASKEFANDLKFGFHKIDKELKALRPKGIGNKSSETSFVNYINDTYSDKDLDDIAEEYKLQKASGITHYIFATNGNLRDELKKQIHNNVINPDDEEILFQLNAYLRYYLNNSLARSYNSFYTPSISRSVLAREVNVNVVENLKKIMDEALSKSVREEDIGVPTMMKALVEKSKGNPTKMIELALEYRDKAEPMRKWLDKKLNPDKKNTIKDLNELNKELDDLKSVFFSSIKLVNDNKSSGLSKLNFSLPFDLIKVSLNIDLNFKDYLKRLKHKKRINILTEITNDAIASNLLKDVNQLEKIFN